MRLSIRRSARRFAQFALLSTVMLLPLVGISTMSGPTSPAAAAIPPTAYVTNEAGNSLTPINVATNTAGGVIAGSNLYGPEGIAITPNGQTAVVANANPNIGCGSTVTVINLTTDAQTLIDDSELSCPASVAITPNGQMAYVVSTYNNLPGSLGGPEGTVTPIDLNNDTAGPSFLAGGIEYPGDIAITPNGQTAYVTGLSDDVAPIDLTTDTSGPLITLPGDIGGTGIAITPNGQTAYVSGFAGGSPSEVVPIDIATNTAGTPITGGSLAGPNAIAITPNGQTAYVTNADGNWITPIDLASGVAGPAITGPPEVAGALGIAITPDGRTAYVTGNNEIVPFDLSTGVAEPAITGGGLNGAWDIAITPDQAPTASFTMPPTGVKGSPMTFDASASTSPVGSIASYAWNFGDGTTQMTTQPTIAHTYLTGGVYNVTLTVTNTQGTSSTQVFTGQTVSNNGGASAQTSQTALVAGLYISGSLPGGTVGTSYSASLLGNFGLPPYRWTVSSGSLPAGLHLVATTGAITGIPAAAGTANFVVTVTDSFRPHEVASSPESITIAQGTPSISLSAKLGTYLTANYGTPLTLIARVTPSDHAVPDTSAIEFTANGQVVNSLCAAGAGPTVTTDKAVCPLFTSDFGVGTLALSASIAADSNYIGATSPPGTSVTISAAATTLRLTLSPTTGSVSAETVITATAKLSVSPKQFGGASPVGDPVSVEYEGSVLCSAPIAEIEVLVDGVLHEEYVASCTFAAGTDGMAPTAAAIVATFNPGGTDSDYHSATATANLRLLA